MHIAESLDAVYERRITVKTAGEQIAPESVQVACFERKGWVFVLFLLKKL